MRKAFTALAMMLAITMGGDGGFRSAAQAASLTAEMAAQVLQPSIAKLKRSGSFICTAWKFGSVEWATAWHCLAMTGKEYTVHTQKPDENTGGLRLKVKSILIPVEKGEKKNNYEDWGVMRVDQTTPDIPALAVDCKYDVVLGESVAYMGFPQSGREQLEMFSTGIVTNIKPGKTKPWHFAADLVGGPGASGSPVIALKTGDVIGFLTRGIGSRMGLMSVGMESVAGMDYCELKADEAGSETTGGGGFKLGRPVLEHKYPIKATQ